MVQFRQFQISTYSAGRQKLRHRICFMIIIYGCPCWCLRALRYWMSSRRRPCAVEWLRSCTLPNIFSIHSACKIVLKWVNNKGDYCKFLSYYRTFSGCLFMNTWMRVILAAKSIFKIKKTMKTWILYSRFRTSWLYINKIQLDATVCRCLFTAKLLYMFRVSIAPIIRSTSNCNCSFWYRSYHVSDQQFSTSVALGHAGGKLLI